MTMAMTFELTATKREELGSSANRRLRRLDNRVPAVIYGGGIDKSPESISLNHDHVVVALEHEAFYSHILTIKVDGHDQKVIIKGLQRHPFKRKIVHLDFLRINPNAKVTMRIPLHFKGDLLAPGIAAGGTINHLMADLEISCLPKDLPEFIEVDLSHLQLDEVLHVHQLVLPTGVEPAHAKVRDAIVASPRASIEEATAAAAAEKKDAKPAAKPAAKAAPAKAAPAAKPAAAPKKK
jgi:large subunit ribosomal protein L25